MSLDARFVHEVSRSLRAGTTVVLVRSDEEARALIHVEAIGDAVVLPVHVWSTVSGCDGEGRGLPVRDILDRVRGTSERAIWVLPDALGELDPATRRRLRELAQHEHGPIVVLVAETGASDPLRVAEIPELAVVDLPRPDRDALATVVAEAADMLERSGHAGARARLQPAGELVAAAALGLTELELERVIAEVVVEYGPDPAALLAHLVAVKSLRLDRRGLLDLADAVPLDDIGGLATFKAWLARRALAFAPEAAAAGIEHPRGVLLLGVQGCGKSLAARGCAAAFGLPLVRLDPGRLFGGTVGESEANLRHVVALLDRMAPVVVWLDEIDKTLAGADGARSDAGTTARVLGTLLTWLAERTRPVFVAATANRVDVLPPELLRRGRLDEVFFVDLPEADERAAITRIHLLQVPARRLGTAPPLADPPEAFLAAARAAAGWSGAELQAALTEARLAALADARPLAATDFERALGESVPLSRARAEDLAAARAWARTRARPAAPRGDQPAAPR